MREGGGGEGWGGASSIILLHYRRCWATRWLQKREREGGDGGRRVLSNHPLALQTLLGYKKVAVEQSPLPLKVNPNAVPQAFPHHEVSQSVSQAGGKGPHTAQIKKVLERASNEWKASWKVCVRVCVCVCVCARARVCVRACVRQFI